MANKPAIKRARESIRKSSTIRERGARRLHKPGHHIRAGSDFAASDETKDQILLIMTCFGRPTFFHYQSQMDFQVLDTQTRGGTDQYRRDGLIYSKEINSFTTAAFREQAGKLYSFAVIYR